jgi:hypothetical protein
VDARSFHSAIAWYDAVVNLMPGHLHRLAVDREQELGLVLDASALPGE